MASPFPYAFPTTDLSTLNAEAIPAALLVIVFPLWSHTIGRRLTFQRRRSRWVS